MADHTMQAVAFVRECAKCMVRDHATFGLPSTTGSEEDVRHLMGLGEWKVLLLLLLLGVGLVTAASYVVVLAKNKQLLGKVA